ncbi:MAG: hypothetical protein R2882_02485 [Gemmatimonadales bacterium]
MAVSTGMPAGRADLRTLVLLAFRHLVVRRGRAVLLLFGYAVGTAVMMVLLSVGEAMLIQSRDVALVGGGDVTVLPEGIDLEGLRTGSMSGLFYGIDRARFLERQLVGGGRLDDVVAATSPVIENKLVYLERDGTLLTLRAGAELPAAARAVGAGLPVVAGRWEDAAADRRFATPTPTELYDELDRFHPPAADSTWAEWHYFNVAPGPDEWWYLTFLVGGPLAEGRGGGQLLVTRQRPGRAPARFEANFPQSRIRFDTAAADLSVGPNTVVQRDGRYRIAGTATGPEGTVRFDLEVTPAPNAYFPPIELRSDRFVSGYAVPALRATASGTICEAGQCRSVDAAPAYHDHNWGVWRETTWNWGQGRGREASIVYGGVLTPDSVSSSAGTPYFLAVVDSQGVRQILRFDRIEYRGARPIAGRPGLSAPESFELLAVRAPDTLRVSVAVRHVQATPYGPAGGLTFLQMRGDFEARGKLLGAAFADTGQGFFETFVR